MIRKIDNLRRSNEEETFENSIKHLKSTIKLWNYVQSVLVQSE